MNYWLAISGKENAEGKIRISLEDYPVNDDFIHTAAVEATEFNLSASYSGATRETGEPVHGGVSSDWSLWWTLTAEETARMRLDTVGSGFDTVLAVYQGSSISDLTQVAFNDDETQLSSDSVLEFDATKGETYHIVVGGDSSSDGSINLRGGIAAPAEIIEDPTDIHQALGASATFRVSIDRFAFASYQWYRDGLLIPNGTSNALRIPRVGIGDQASYHVVVTNPFGSRTSNTVELRLTYTSSKVVTNPSSQSVVLV